jgi:hypothetical protein
MACPPPSSRQRIPEDYAPPNSDEAEDREAAN